MNLRMPKGRIPPHLLRFFRPVGHKQKDLVNIPCLVAEALREDGWYLRSDIIWAKRSPMPESVRDRPTKAHEYLFMLSKRPTYYYDAFAIKEKAIGEGNAETFYRPSRTARALNGKPSGSELHGDRVHVVSGRNKRSVWTLSNDPCKMAHFAVMPRALVKPCVLAGTSEEGVCPHCGAPWRRVVSKRLIRRRPAEGGTQAELARQHKVQVGGNNVGSNSMRDGFREMASHTTGWQPGCQCEANKPVPAVVLDPFAGAGTTLYVATKYGRRGIGCELNPEYAVIARKRIKRLTDGRLFA